MSEEVLDDGDRAAILGALLRPKPKAQVSEATVVSTPQNVCECGHAHNGKCTNKFCSCVESRIVESKLEDFGTLLEQSLAKRQAYDEGETGKLDEMKKEVVKHSNFDIIKNWKF